jgi:hypothetical protein
MAGNVFDSDDCKRGRKSEERQGVGKRMPTGPIGTASENPMTAPSTKYMNFMQLDRLR